MNRLNIVARHPQQPSSSHRDNRRACAFALLAFCMLATLPHVHAQRSQAPLVVPADDAAPQPRRDTATPATPSPAAPTAQPVHAATVAGNTTSKSPTSGNASRTSLSVLPVVHRLTGLKLLTSLGRNSYEVSADSTTSFVHTNIVAGYLIHNSRIVVAYLPRAEVEAETYEMPPGLLGDSGNIGGEEPAAFSVVRPDGRQMLAKFIGLDASTGLSLLELDDAASETSAQASSQQTAQVPSQQSAVPVLLAALGTAGATKYNIGDTFRLVSPEASGANAPDASGEAKVVRLRLVEVAARVVGAPRAPDGEVAQVIVRTVGGETLSPALVGAVAVDDAGNFVGVVELIVEKEAVIIPTNEIKQAAARVLTRRSSVPQPWLGAQGHAIADTPIERLIESGWKIEQARRLVNERQGVMLTVVPPNTPAAAGLRAGDIVMRIGTEPVGGIEDFSRLLTAAGGDKLVRFTVLRSGDTVPRVVEVRLGASLNPMRETSRAMHLAQLSNSVSSLLAPLGIEIITIPSTFRQRLGAEDGLLIVGLRREGVAASSGLRVGDCIERVNGQLLTETSAAAVLFSANKREATFDIIRGKQRISLTIKFPASKP